MKSRTDEELGDIVNFLLQFDFDIIYRPGKRNMEADCLSRNPVLESTHNMTEKEIIKTVNVLKLQEIKEMSRKYKNKWTRYT